MVVVGGRKKREVVGERELVFGGGPSGCDTEYYTTGMKKRGEAWRVLATGAKPLDAALEI